jgi:hypothetical protein
LYCLLIYGYHSLFVGYARSYSLCRGV